MDIPLAVGDMVIPSPMYERQFSNLSWPAKIVAMGRDGWGDYIDIDQGPGRPIIRWSPLSVMIVSTARSQKSCFVRRI